MCMTSSSHISHERLAHLADKTAEGLKRIADGFGDAIQNEMLHSQGFILFDGRNHLLRSAVGRGFGPRCVAKAPADTQ